MGGCDARHAMSPTEMSLPTRTAPKRHITNSRYLHDPHGQLHDRHDEGALHDAVFSEVVALHGVILRLEPPLALQHGNFIKLGEHLREITSFFHDDAR